MSQRVTFAKSCIRVAEEVQLEAEEEWIEDALKKLKKQRNCLQIERLHLESLKAQLQTPAADEEEKEQPDQRWTEEPSTFSAVDLMNMKSMQNKDELAAMDDASCNQEELDLNLMASNSMFDGSETPNHYEYDDMEGSSSEEEGDNMMIDINMLMSGNVPSHCN